MLGGAAGLGRCGRPWDGDDLNADDYVGRVDFTTQDLIDAYRTGRQHPVPPHPRSRSLLYVSIKVTESGESPP